MRDKPTFDTNILIYAFGKPDDANKQIAKSIIANCSIISVQVLNETSYVLLRKFNFQLSEIEKVIGFIKQKFIISNITIHILDHTLKIASAYGFSFWDSMMIASALDNHCSVIYTEDLQHGQVIENKLKIINPFINHKA